jgi:DNA-directed RNA polymerase subunit RPC12/RpoP
MSLMDCPECGHRVSDKAYACPSCGYPLAAQPGQKGSQWPAVVGGVAGTWISAKALTTIIVGVVMFLGFFAVMIAAIVSN